MDDDLMRNAPPGDHPDDEVAGLILRVADDGSAHWLCQVMLDGVPRLLAIGTARGAKGIPLAEARRRAGRAGGVIVQSQQAVAGTARQDDPHAPIPGADGDADAVTGTEVQSWFATIGRGARPPPPAVECEAIAKSLNRYVKKQRTLRMIAQDELYAEALAGVASTIGTLKRQLEHAEKLAPSGSPQQTAHRALIGALEESQRIYPSPEPGRPPPRWLHVAWAWAPRIERLVQDLGVANASAASRAGPVAEVLGKMLERAFPGLAGVDAGHIASAIEKRRRAIKAASPTPKSSRV